MKKWHSFTRSSRFVVVAAAGAIISLGAASTTQAQTFKFANQGDALSMDPHSLNESFQLSFTGNIYEPLIGRGKRLEVVPILATDWKQTAPTVWRFNLRKSVLFHDGTPFTADDVGHIPLHQQALTWAMKRNIDLVQLADNYMFIKWVSIKQP